MKTQYDELKAMLFEVLHEIMLHGHGDVHVRVVMGQELKRKVSVEAGKSVQFTIPEADLR
jgi:ABC-type lipoprotein release transport system permease subunit